MFEAMKQLFGYGHPQARLWVIGLEEHCGNAADIAQRIALRTANPQAFLDVEEFHHQLPGGMPPIEAVSVWRIAREIYRGVFGADTEVGRADPERSDLLLSEIMPLPRPQINQWPEAYHAWFDTPEDYLKDALPIMVERLVAMVAAHRPSVVLLHGKTQHNRWIRQRTSPLRDGWTHVPVVNQPNRTVSWQCRDGTLWVLTNNLVNTGFVQFGPAQIEQVVHLIRDNVVTCRPDDQQ